MLSCPGRGHLQPQPGHPAQIDPREGSSIMQFIFNLLCWVAGEFGWIDPAGVNLQHIIWQVAHWLGYSVTVAVG